MENDRLLIVSFKYTYYFHGAFFYYIFFTIKDTPINSCMLFSNMITYTWCFNASSCSVKNFKRPGTVLLFYN